MIVLMTGMLAFLLACMSMTRWRVMSKCMSCIQIGISVTKALCPHRHPPPSTRVYGKLVHHKSLRKGVGRNYPAQAATAPRDRIQRSAPRALRRCPLSHEQTINLHPPDKDTVEVKDGRRTRISGTWIQLAIHESMNLSNPAQKQPILGVFPQRSFSTP